MKSILLSLAAALMLQACTSVVLSTAAMLNATSPLDADPSGFEIAVTIPDGVRVPQGGATMGFEATNERLQETIKGEYALEQRATKDAQTLFRIAPDDLPAVLDFQAKAREWETADPSNSSGSFSVGVTFCKVGNGPALDDTFSVSIRTKTDGVFLPLIRNAKVSAAMELLEENKQDLPENLLCEE